MRRTWIALPLLVLALNLTTGCDSDTNEEKSTSSTSQAEQLSRDHDEKMTPFSGRLGYGLDEIYGDRNAHPENPSTRLTEAEDLLVANRYLDAAEANHRRKTPHAKTRQEVIERMRIIQINADSEYAQGYLDQ
jgi:hypothetical protein